jgi:tetratricopeptide (TPR) repeat protein
LNSLRMNRRLALLSLSLSLCACVLTDLIGFAAPPVHKAPVKKTATSSHRPAVSTAAHHPVSKAPVKPMASAKAPVKAGVAGRPTLVKTTAIQTKTADPNAFITYYKTGRDLFIAKKYVAAEAPLKTSLALVEKQSPQSKNTALVAHMLGNTYYNAGHYTNAVPVLKKTLQLLQIPANHDEDELLNTLSVLGTIDMYLHDFISAQSHMEAALPLTQKLRGPENEQTRMIRDTLDDLSRIDTQPDYLSSLNGKPIMRWQDPQNQPIRIFIRDGAGISGWRPQVGQWVKDSYNEWGQALSGLVRFEFTEDPEQADCIVSWVDAPMVNNEHEGELRSGLTDSHFNPQGYWFEDSITVALNDREGNPATEDAIHNTLLHEIEHSLGLNGEHSLNPADVLYRSNRYDGKLRKRLTARDISTVRALYALSPNITNPPGINMVRYSHVVAEVANGVPLYNAQDYANAYTHFRNALTMYDMDADANYFTGLAAWRLERFDEAIPLLTRVAGDPHTGRRADAAKMVGYVLMDAAGKKAKTGHVDLAERDYQEAQRYLTYALQAVPMDANTQKDVKAELNWLLQRQAIIQANGYASGNVISGLDSVTGASVDNPDQPRKKKKGFFSKWLGSETPYTNKAPVYVMMPGSMAGF